MPIESAAPQFPPSESLRRFFRTDPRARVPVVEAASLLGVAPETLRAMLQEEGGHPPEDAIAWSEAAALLFDAWPRAEIFDALDADFDDLIPAELRLARVSWRLPLFIIRAMEHQAARANALHARRIEDYIADLLYAEIQPATLNAFRNDSAFLRAFHYPMAD